MTVRSHVGDMNTSRACMAAVALVGLSLGWPSDAATTRVTRPAPSIGAPGAGRPAAAGRRRAGPLLLGQPVPPTRTRGGRTVRERRPPPHAHLVDLVPPRVCRRRRAAPSLRPQPSDRARPRLGHRQEPERGVARGRDDARWLQLAGPTGRDPSWARPRTGLLDGPRPGSSMRSPTSTASRPVGWPAACGLPPPALLARRCRHERADDRSQAGGGPPGPCRRVLCAHDAGR